MSVTGPGRPARVFDRSVEWDDLVDFATMDVAGPRLGIVHGRRREGKSFLLRAVVEQLGGIYHQALEEERSSALTSLGSTLASDAGLTGAVALPSWDAAIRELVGRPGAGRVVVLDEFPFLAEKAPELESVVQRAYDDARDGRLPPFRLLLCGSAISVMGRLLSGTRPLRGRAALQLQIAPFDFRTAAAYWGISDPETAFLVHAVVGGTPGYRDLLGERAPGRPADLFDWLAAGPLNPSHALFSEDAYLLTEDPSISDRALYQSVLGAITAGRGTQREVGGALGRTDQAMQHPLLVLEGAGLVRRESDVLLGKRPVLRMADPILRFIHAIVRPDRARFEARRTQEAWSEAAARFETLVIGPHFDELAREWTRSFASPQTLGGRARQVGFTNVNDPAARERFEIDVVAATDARPGDPRPVLLAIGEAKGGTTRVGIGELHRLERLRSLLERRAIVEGTRLILFARSSFEPAVVAEANRRSDLVLVDLDRLYGGS